MENNKWFINYYVLVGGFTIMDPIKFLFRHKKKQQRATIIVIVYRRKKKIKKEKIVHEIEQGTTRYTRRNEYTWNW